MFGQKVHEAISGQCPTAEDGKCESPCSGHDECIEETRKIRWLNLSAAMGDAISWALLYKNDPADRRERAAGLIEDQIAKNQARTGTQATEGVLDVQNI